MADSKDFMKNFTGMGVDLSIEDGEWKKYLGANPKHGRIERVGILPNSTSLGKPTFQVLARMDDGTMIVVETTWALINTAARAIAVRWPVKD